MTPLLPCRQLLADLLGTLAREVAGEGAPAMFFEDQAPQIKPSKRNTPSGVTTSVATSPHTANNKMKQQKRSRRDA